LAISFLLFCKFCGGKPQELFTSRTRLLHYYLNEYDHSVLLRV